MIYPGLESHPQHALAKSQMSAFGGIVSVELDRDLEGTKRFLENTKLFTLAESLGGVESLIEHRASIEGAGSPCPTDLLRLSTGIEDVGDLYDDLDQALKAGHRA